MYRENEDWSAKCQDNNKKPTWKVSFSSASIDQNKIWYNWVIHHGLRSEAELKKIVSSLEACKKTKINVQGHIDVDSIERKKG